MKKNKPKDYEQIHYWLRKNFGSPNICENKDCEQKSNRYDWALKKGFEHAKNKDNYFRMCRKCHVKYDWTEERTNFLIEQGHTESANKKRNEVLRGVPKSEVSRKNMKKAAFRRPIIQTKDDIILKEYKSLQDAANDTGVTVSSIWLNLSGRQPTSKGFVYRYKCERHEDRLQDTNPNE